MARNKRKGWKSIDFQRLSLFVLLFAKSDDKTHITPPKLARISAFSVAFFVVAKKKRRFFLLEKYFLFCFVNKVLTKKRVLQVN